MVFVLVVVLVAALGAGGFFAYKKFFAPAAPGQLPGADQQAAVVQPGSTTPAGDQPAMSGQPAAPDFQQPAATPAPASDYTSTSNSNPSARTPAQPPATTSSIPAAAPETFAPSAPAAAPASEPPPAPAPAPEPKRVEILKPETPVPQEAPPPAAQPAQTAYSGPPAGVILWSGRLDKNGSITISGNSASFGNLTGELPGVPVMIEVDQREFALAETPSPSNGWKRITIRSRSKRHSVVSIKWSILR
jgi:hypothetical protein